MLILIALCASLVIALLMGRLLAEASRRDELYAAFERDLSESVNGLKETPMLDFDSNGIALKPDGSRTYKRYAELMVDGRRVMGGVYIGQSTTEVYLVELHEVESETRQGSYKTEVWKPTGQLASVHLSNVIRVFEPHADTSPALDTVDGLARYILDPTNIGHPFTLLRTAVFEKVKLPPAPKGYSWDHTTATTMYTLPEAQTLLADKSTTYERICAACAILDRAVELMRNS